MRRWPLSCRTAASCPHDPKRRAAMAQEPAVSRQPTHTVYTIVETGGEKSRWLECGVAFTNRDGSLNLLLNALPVNGRLQVRTSNGRGERDAEG
jgi:hypothetical protein